MPAPVPKRRRDSKPISASLPSRNKITSLLRMVLGSKFIATARLWHLPCSLTLPRYFLLVSTVATKDAGPQKATGSRGRNRQCCSPPGSRLLPQDPPATLRGCCYCCSKKKKSLPSAWFVFSPWPVQRGKHLNDSVGNFWANRMRFNHNRNSVLPRNLQQEEHVLIPPAASEGRENAAGEPQRANLRRKRVHENKGGR